jgi:transposase
MLTVVTSLKLQRRNVLEFMALAVGAQRHGTPVPSLLPELEVNDEQVINAA